jgi:YVTN family beta-propeller protein
MKYSTLLLATLVLAATGPPNFSDSEQAIRFGEFAFAPGLRKVLIPGGNTMKMALVEPDTQNIEIVAGFGVSLNSSDAARDGLTSADACRNLIYAADRGEDLLYVVDPHTRTVVASVPLASKPEHVRFVADTDEIWVTEPSSERIEFFTLPGQGIPQPKHTGFLTLAGEPRSLVVDHTRGRAYANLSSDTTLAVRITDHQVVSRWLNGCRRSGGIALAEKRGFLFVGCTGGGVTVLDVASGKFLGKAESGSNTAVIAYNQKLNHLYVLEPETDILAIVGISKTGAGKVLDTVRTAGQSNCVIADDRQHVYVCDPSRGTLLTYKDSLPATM